MTLNALAKKVKDMKDILVSLHPKPEPTEPDVEYDIIMSLFDVLVESLEGKFLFGPNDTKASSEFEEKWMKTFNELIGGIVSGATKMGPQQ